MSEKIKLALLFGGDCSEREISLRTAKAMAGAIDRRRYELHVLDVRSNTHSEGELPLSLDRLSAEDADALQAWWSDLRTDGVADTVGWSELPGKLRESRIDVALSALHGGWGENGTVQSLLEVAGIPYVGSPAKSSMLAMDKRLGKAIVRDAGIPVAKGALLASPDDAPPFDGPCVVKPNAGGSSVGVTIFPGSYNAEQWKAAVDTAFADGSGVLVEEFIAGIEVTAAVLGEGADAQALPVIEIVPQGDAEFYDFKAKYATGGSAHLIPPRLPEEVQHHIQQQALAVFRTFGCRGVARADFIVTPEGVPYFLEINTLPGMTSTSLVPDAARAAGISFEELVEKLIAEALQ